MKMSMPSVARARALAAAALVALISVTASTAAFAAAKSGAIKVFDGIEIGRTTLEEYVERRSATCPVKVAGDSVINVSPRCLGVPFTNIIIGAPAFDKPIWFVALETPEDMMGSSFDEYARQLVKRFGQPKAGQLPFAGDRYLVWEKKTLLIEMSSSFMDFGAGTILYMTPEYKKTLEAPKAAPKRRAPAPSPVEPPAPAEPKPEVPERGNEILL